MYGIRPGDLDEMTRGELRAFQDDWAALCAQQDQQAQHEQLGR